MSLCQEEDSELAFGWYDPTRYIGELDWHPVVNKFFWSLQLDDIKVTTSDLSHSLVQWGLDEHL